ncbi:hypothetical protein ACHAWF_000782, partial [Thalassiosira exigua]
PSFHPGHFRRCRCRDQRGPRRWSHNIVPYSISRDECIMLEKKRMLRLSFSKRGVIIQFAVASVAICLCNIFRFFLTLHSRDTGNEALSSKKVLRNITIKSRHRPSSSYHTDSFPSKRIPRNILLNSKNGIDHLSPLIKLNIQRNIDLFPGWRVISDDDNSCMNKSSLAYTSIFGSLSLSFNSTLEKWYSDKKIEGKFKSDLCRLAQLYLDGGVYLDNDLELTSSLGDIFEHDVDVVTSLARGPNAIFQAIFGCTKGNDIIRHSLGVFREHLEGITKVKYHHIGTEILFTSLREVYNLTGNINRTRLLNQGIYLLKEVDLPASHPMMKNRSLNNYCQIALEGILNNKHPKSNDVHLPPFYGFSRVKHFGHPYMDISCKRRMPPLADLLFYARGL